MFALITASQDFQCNEGGMMGKSLREAREEITGDSWLDDLARASLSAAEASQQPPSPKRRRGTNVRQRQAQVSVRLTAEEYAAVKAAADEQRRSPAFVLRTAFFGNEDSAG
jgi:hypothetical protein